MSSSIPKQSEEVTQPDQVVTNPDSPASPGNPSPLEPEQPPSLAMAADATETGESVAIAADAAETGESIAMAVDATETGESKTSLPGRKSSQAAGQPQSEFEAIQPAPEKEILPEPQQAPGRGVGLPRIRTYSKLQLLNLLEK
eukprot:m.130306 g.130306  ORF g.130306 m.130306 type:complete len:143 (+) comp38018_c0_seq2:48-476(+)